MKSRYYSLVTVLAGVSLLLVTSCKTPDYGRLDPLDNVPDSYATSTDTTTIADISWKNYFQDTCLSVLIDSALLNNQELNIVLRELNVSQNEVMARKGEYLPSLGVRAGGGADKVGRYTKHGAMEATTELVPGEELPEVVPDLNISAFASWEIDIWGKLRNAKKAAALRYLSSIEGRNFMITNMVSEIASSYYELQTLDQRLKILDSTIQLQSNALRIVKLQKESAKATELAVKRFQAEVLHTTSRRFEIQQMIVVAENRINFLVGRYPQPVVRNSQSFDAMNFDTIQAGIPVQLLDRRTDMRQVTLLLEASKLDVASAKAAFYPSIGLNGGIGLNALNPTYLIRPQSLMFNLAGDLITPLVNRNAIKAKFYNANAEQVQAVYTYEQTLLTAYIEVVNEMSNIDNLQKTYELQRQQVEALTDGVRISNDLYMSARANYMEVLMTQRDALEAKLELIDTKKEQLVARVQIYRALGGGWK